MIDEKRLETAPVQHVRNLLESIKEGKLTVTYYDPIDPSYSRTYEVTCTSADADEFVERYESLTRALLAIGEARAKLSDGRRIEDCLSSDRVDVWKTYVCDFEETFDDGGYAVAELYARREDGDELSDGENEALQRHYEWFEAQCLKRLPRRGYSPMPLVNRAQRYEYFIRMNAPKSVINEEGRCLAEEMILYYAVK